MAAVISPSYLRKLERGQVNDPSPRVLRRVAAALDLGYLRLMALAGYLTDADSGDAPAGALADGLTGEERKALQAFAEFLISRRRPVGTGSLRRPCGTADAVDSAN